MFCVICGKKNQKSMPVIDTASKTIAAAALSAVKILPPDWRVQAVLPMPCKRKCAECPVLKRHRVPLPDLPTDRVISAEPRDAVAECAA